MNRIIICVTLCLYLIVTSSASELSDKIKQLPNVVGVEELEVIPFFSEKYLVWVRQPIEHTDTTKGFFKQRVFVCHRGCQNPVVMVTEGYNADYASKKAHKNELCDILDANQIVIEHRYFAESAPQPLEWQYLTTKNAAADHHVINQIFKTIYKGKWVGTGISKGGQTAILYKAFYPDDVDATVPYVAPDNFGVEDGRHEPFIAKTISTRRDRKKVLKFQLEVLKRRATLIDDFKAFIKKENFTFKTSIDTVYDLCVLEYSFAFWQWGTKPSSIPSLNAPDSVIFNHFIDVASPDYFSIEGSEKYVPFFVQAAHELGYYGYDTKPFEKYLVMKKSDNYLLNIFLRDIYRPEYVETMAWASKKIEQDGNNMLFIYGEYDPWSATAYVKGDRDDQVIIFSPKASHRARVDNLPPVIKRRVIKTLKGWLDMN